jgi:hypothetical protein
MTSQTGLYQKFNYHLMIFAVSIPCGLVGLESAAIIILSYSVDYISRHMEASHKEAGVPASTEQYRRFSYIIAWNPEAGYIQDEIFRNSSTQCVLIHQ